MLRAVVDLKVELVSHLTKLNDLVHNFSQMLLSILWYMDVKKIFPSFENTWFAFQYVTGAQVRTIIYLFILKRDASIEIFYVYFDYALFSHENPAKSAFAESCVQVCIS